MIGINFVSHHFKWRTWPVRGQNNSAFCGGGALGSAISFLSSERSVSLDGSSWSGSGCSAGSLTSIGKNVSLIYHKSVNSTQLSRGHWLCHCRETSLWFSLSRDTNKKHSSHQVWTLHALEAPRKVYVSTTDIRCAWSSSVHSRWMRCAFYLCIRTSSPLLASVNYDHRFIVYGFAIWIIQWAASH